MYKLNKDKYLDDTFVIPVGKDSKSQNGMTTFFKKPVNSWK